MEGAVVDPGGDIELILKAVEKTGAKLVKILLTHGHLDHVGATAELASLFGIPIEGPQIDENSLIAQLPQQCVMFGFPPVQAFTPDRWLQQGDTVSFRQANTGGLALSRPHKGPCGVFPSRRPLGLGWRCAV